MTQRNLLDLDLRRSRGRLRRIGFTAAAGLEQSQQQGNRTETTKGAQEHRRGGVHASPISPARPAYNLTRHSFASKLPFRLVATCSASPGNSKSSKPRTRPS